MPRAGARWCCPMQRSAPDRLGSELQSIRGQVANQDALVQLLAGRREELSGVSLDEEGMQLLRFQRAYEAAAPARRSASAATWRW